MSHTRENHAGPASENSSRDGRGALSLYLREIQSIPLLTPAEEKALGRKVLAGDRAAVDELVRRNLRFVVMVARPYARHGMPLEDLVNEGNLGLIRAAERFDVDRGFRFISYAVWWVRQAILAYLADKGRLVRLPVGQSQLLSRLAQNTTRLEQELGRAPMASEIGKRMHLPVEKIEWLRSLPTLPCSLDAPADGEESQFEIDTLEDTSSPTIEEQIESIERAADVSAALSHLDARDGDVVKRYFGFAGEPESLRSIGRSHGVTRERTRQLRDRAIQALRIAPETELLAEHAQ